MMTNMHRCQQKSDSSQIDVTTEMWLLLVLCGFVELLPRIFHVSEIQNTSQVSDTR